MKELTESQYHSLCKKVQKMFPTLPETERARIINLSIEYYEKGQKATQRTCATPEVIATHPYKVQ